ncbi:MAG TPA: translation elongation factor Ts [candidate division Zixibacteria bacterium]|nr:translation elongation factor Ts [candidate division Zixibacteria bacterium]MDD4916901.1 translation elongation factor Ts [candidate division Zixibacteria bacterium]MDM7972157.1 translation elongation factor Ts [candidate division Zixibacteria bacterium]HOD66735.1 translation elongation factor Ts [candidate division Zixibacteria bacterium]HOZ07328.1 translation elongation factor Ts [candidate division Zixibacteria bacterium]
MDISAQLVKELREKTGAGMMDCKKALTETHGDLSKAIDYLREQGISKAAKKEGRATAEGVIATYVHPGDKLGVMVEVNCETDFVARTDQLKEFARNIAMHIAASAPLVVSRDEVDPALIAKEREIYRHQTLKEGKPEKIVDKIVDGRIEKYFGEVVLMEQPFVKDADKTIEEYLKETIARLGENMKVRRFARFRLGE